MSDTSEETTAVPLTTEELVASVDPDTELAQTIANIRNINWYQQFLAIESARRLIVHHTTTLATSDQLADILYHIRLASRNLRSAASKNALLALAETIEYMHAVDTVQQLTGSFTNVLVKRAACEKRFLREAAEIGLRKLSIYAPQFSTIEYLLKFSKDRHPKTCLAAARTISQCVVNLVKREKQTTGQNNSTTHSIVPQSSTFPCSVINADQLKMLLAGLALFRAGREPETRVAARKTLISLRILLGPAEFDCQTRETLDLPNANAVIADSKGSRPNKRPKSLRDLIRRDKVYKQKSLPQLAPLDEVKTKTKTPNSTPRRGVAMKILRPNRIALDSLVEKLELISKEDK